MFSLVSQQMHPHTFVLRFEFMKLLIFIAHHVGVGFSMSAILLGGSVCGVDIAGLP